MIHKFKVGMRVMYRKVDSDLYGRVAIVEETYEQIISGKLRDVIRIRWEDPNVLKGFRNKYSDKWVSEVFELVPVEKEIPWTEDIITVPRPKVID